MEFLLYLTPIGRDIYDLISQKIKVLENPPICRTHNIYGWYDSSQDIMSICTENIKNGPDPEYYMNETIYHESVHLAQDCNAKWSGEWYKPFNISPSIMSLTQRRLSDLSTSVKLNNQDRQIEHEAFWMEDKPEKVKYVVQKYCF